jgi:hypothetical protein
MGCVVDTRWNIHEKVAIIDDKVVWFGSLNPLSNTGATDEVMARMEGCPAALQIASLLSLYGTSPSEATAGVAARKENPTCPCGGRATFRRGRYGPYWECEDACGWSQSFDRAGGRNSQAARVSLGGDIPSCPKCGSPMKAKSGRFGSFWGCSHYPSCDGIVKPDRAT